METPDLYRGRLIDHVELVVRDLGAAQTFYTEILKALGIPMGGSGVDFFWADELFVTTPARADPQRILSGRHRLGLQAHSRAMVDAFYAQGLANGGIASGAPGEHAQHPGCYAASLLDPDGNSIEAVYHAGGQRSAGWVHIRFD